MAIQKSQTIGPVILPLPAGDLSRLGSGERNLSRQSGTKAVRPSERARTSQRRGEGELYGNHLPAHQKFLSTLGTHMLAVIQSPNPQSTLAHPKSIVDSGSEPLIRVENSLVSHRSQACYKPIIRPENKGIKPKSNRHRPKIVAGILAMTQSLLPVLPPCYRKCYHLVC